MAIDHHHLALSETPSDKARAVVRLADLIRTEILDGTFATGSPLPAEADLRRANSAGRNVVRAALDLLRRDGLITRRPGQGTMVCSERAPVRLDQPVGISSSFGGGGQRVITRFISVEQVGAVGPVAQSLAIESGAPCLAIEYETEVDRRPYSLATSYVDAERWGVHFLTDLGGDWFGDWYIVLRRLGLDPGRLDLRLEVTPADETTAQILDIEAGHPVFRFERLLHDVMGRPLDFGYSRCRADRVVLDFRVTPQSEADHQAPPLPFPDR